MLLLGDCYLPLVARNYPATPTSTPSSGSLFETVLLVADPGGYANIPDNASLDLGRADGEDFTIENFFYVSNLTDNDPVIDLVTRKDKSYQLHIKFNNVDPDWVSFRLWTADVSTYTQPVLDVHTDGTCTSDHIDSGLYQFPAQCLAKLAANPNPDTRSA